MKNNLHIYNCGLFTNFLDNLEESGFSLNRFKTRYGLKNYRFVKDTYVPASLMHDLLQEVWMTVGKRSFVAANMRSLSIYDLVDFEPHTSTELDLYTALEVFLKQANNFKSNVKVDFKLRTGMLAISFHFPDELCLGRRIVEQIWLIFLLDLIKKFRGSAWSPKALHVTSPSIEGLRGIELIEEYPILFCQPCYRIMLEPASPNFTIEERWILQQSEYEEKDFDFVRNIEKILQSYQPDHRPTLVELATLFKTSARSIKRHLNSGQTTFSTILATNILKSAMQQLCTEDLKIQEISEKLGYSDSPNFVRSFKRWTGITPNAFREKILG